MGGAIALAYTMRFQQHLDGLMLSGPASTGGRSYSVFERLQLEILSRIAPRFRLTALPSTAICRDAAVVAAYDRDPLVYHEGPTARLRYELRGAVRAFPEHMPDIKVPVLVQHGSADALVSPAASRLLADRLGSQSVTLHVYEGLAHEVFNEPERQQVLDDLVSWLEAQCPRRS
jgi:alpha-beta hydrolase superfamily lysophospholipase